MESNLFSSDIVTLLCKALNIDLFELKKDVPKTDWDEDFFLLDKCDFFKKEICINNRFISKESIYKEKIYWIDIFPKIIPIEGRFQQLEIFYMSDDEYGLNALYFQEEKKFLAVLSKLWAYSVVYLESNILYEINLRDEIKDNPQFQVLSRLFSEKSIVMVDEWKIIQYLFSLSLKNHVSTCIYFVDLKIVIWVSSLCATLYICDKEQEDFVRNICTTEGLYLYSKGE